MKICILAYWFPPLRAVGSLRAYHLAKRAQELGHEVRVISIEPGGLTAPAASEPDHDVASMRVHRTRTFDLNAFLTACASKLRPRRANDTATRATGGTRRPRLPFRAFLYRFYKHVICFPDPCLGWYFRARKQVLRIVDEERPDVLVSSGPPFTAFLLGAAAKRRRPDMKWVADYRDLWSQSEVQVRPAPLRRLERGIERRTLRRADLLTTVSEVTRRRLERLHGDRPVVTVYNGYEGTATGTPAEIERFNLTYTGVLYPGANRDPTVLLTALDELRTEGAIDATTFRFRIFGKAPDPFREQVRRMGLDSLVEIHAPVGRSEIAEIQRTSNALVLIEWSRDALPVKLYEYLATGVPLLALAAADSEIHRICKASGRKLQATVEQTKAFIRAEHEHWQRTGHNRVTAVDDSVRQFSRDRQSERWIEHLEALLSRDQGVKSWPDTSVATPKASPACPRQGSAARIEPGSIS